MFELWVTNMERANYSPPASVGNLEMAAVRECVCQSIRPSACPQPYLDNRLIDLIENLHSDSVYIWGLTHVS